MPRLRDADGREAVVRVALLAGWQRGEGPSRQGRAVVVRSVQPAPARPAGTAIPARTGRNLNFGAVAPLGRRLGSHVFRRFLIAPGDVLLQHPRLHPPLAPAPNLDRGQLAGAHQGISLGRGNIQNLGNISQRQKPLLNHDTSRPQHYPGHPDSEGCDVGQPKASRPAGLHGVPARSRQAGWPAAVRRHRQGSGIAA